MSPAEVEAECRAADEFYRGLAERYDTSVSEFTDSFPVKRSPSRWQKWLTFGGSIGIGFGLMCMSIVDRSVLGYVGGCVLFGAGFMGFAFWIARS